MISAIASIGNFIFNHKTTPASEEFNRLIDKITNTLQMTFDCLDQKEIANKIPEKDAEVAEEQLLEKYKELSKLRDKNISEGRPELDTETLHQLQEAYLIGNHMSWLKSLSENLKKATEGYRLSIVDQN
jgi:hypothetical protein